MVRIYAKTEVFMRSRILKGLTQRDLAQKAGLSHAYISMVERSIKSVGPKAAKKIGELLGKEVDELFNIE